MRRLTTLGLLLLGATLTACGGGGGGGDDDGPIQGVGDFLHFTTAGNINGAATALDHPLANGNPDAQVFFTHNWNPSGAAGEYLDAPCFVGYDDSTGRWQIANILGNMPEGIYFNVTVVTGFSSAWVQVASAGNIVGNATEIDQPSVNGDLSAMMLATKAAPDTDGLFLMPTYEIGLWYDGPYWELLYQSLGSSMGTGATFHLHALPDDGASYVHIATPSNIYGNSTRIPHPDADGDPNAHIQVTKRLESGPYHEARIGVWYDVTTAYWYIYHEDGSAMTVDAAFVVRVK